LESDSIVGARQGGLRSDERNLTVPEVEKVDRQIAAHAARPGLPLDPSPVARARIGRVELDAAQRHVDRVDPREIDRGVGEVDADPRAPRGRRIRLASDEAGDRGEAEDSNRDLELHGGSSKSKWSLL